MPTIDRPICVLFDNGSLRPASTVALRRLAASLEPLIGAPVRPVSLLHSSALPASELDGRPAELLEPALDAYVAEHPDGTAVALPLFFGPSAALTDYVPGRLLALRARHPNARVLLGRELVDTTRPDDVRLASALGDLVRGIMQARGLVRPSVLLVDHGSPQRGVTAVREFIGAQLRRLLGDDVAAVGTASMERRPGPAHDFNEPLLARALQTKPFNEGDVVVALLFFSAGRHAGEGGDIAEICSAAEAKNPDLRTHRTEPLAGHPGLPALLAERYEETIRRDFSVR